jgi:HSP20 family protein
MKTTNYIPVGVELPPVFSGNPLLREIFNLGHPFSVAVTPSSTRGWAPPMDISEDAGKISVSLEAPGLRQEDFTVLFEEGTLKVTGKREAPEKGEDSKWILRESVQGSFSRSFAPSCEIVSDQISATYKDGVLRIALPKSPRAQAQRVEVK